MSCKSPLQQSMQCTSGPSPGLQQHCERPVGRLPGLGTFPYAARALQTGSLKGLSLPPGLLWKPHTMSPPCLQYECENVLADSALLDACGAGLGRQEMYGAMLACKRIGEDPKLGVATVRFFGKVGRRFMASQLDVG